MGQKPRMSSKQMDKKGFTWITFNHSLSCLCVLRLTFLNDAFPFIAPLFQLLGILLLNVRSLLKKRRCPSIAHPLTKGNPVLFLDIC